MKIRVTLLTALFLSIILCAGLFAQQSYNYEEMTQEQYNAYLAEWQQRLDAAQQGISEEEAQIEQLKKQYDELQGQIDATWNEIFQLAQSDKESYDKYVGDLNALKQDVSAFLNLSPEEIYSRSNELDGFQTRLEEFKTSPFSVMTDNAKTIADIQNLIDQAREKAKTAVPPSYTVMRGDYLWKIAAKPDIYGDPYAWMRIYTSNRDQIKDPDLIYPNQVLAIPRAVGPNEYLVQKGEYLAKIAGYANVYGDPFKWNRLYEANKSIIADPNLIYPYQVLKIAR